MKFVPGLKIRDWVLIEKIETGRRYTSDNKHSWIVENLEGVREIIPSKLLRTYLDHKKRTDPVQSALNRLFVVYKRGARHRNLIFKLSKDDFKKLTQANCHFCGNPPTKTMNTCKNKEGYTYNGIDRLDNKEGYVVTNVVPCCTECNWAKGRRNNDDFCKWLDRILEFRSNLIKNSQTLI